MPAETLTVTLLPGAREILAQHQQEMPQKNELCGAFWVTLALRALDGRDLEQDHVGRAAGSLLSVVQTSDSLPPGEPGRDDYVLDLPRTDDPDVDSGTASEGLMVAPCRTDVSWPSLSVDAGPPTTSRPCLRGSPLSMSTGW